jgi:hypothetical protein
MGGDVRRVLVIALFAEQSCGTQREAERNMMPNWQRGTHATAGADGAARKRGTRGDAGGDKPLTIATLELLPRIAKLEASVGRKREDPRKKTNTGRGGGTDRIRMSG